MGNFQESRLQEESGELKGHLPEALIRSDTGLQDGKGLENCQKRHFLVKDGSKG
jgi:hypothetical protein